MAIITEILKSFAKKKDRFGFIGEWMKDINNDDPNFERYMRNASAAYDTLSKEERSSSHISSIMGPSTVGTRGFLSETMAAQYHPETMRLPEMGTLETMGTAIGGIIDMFKGNVWGGISKIGGLLKDEVVLYLGQTNKLFQEINEKAMMTGDLAEGFRDEIMLTSPEATKLGISFDDFSTAVGSLVANSGKFKLMSDETMKDMALASKFTKDMTEFVNMGRKFELIGLGIRDMSTLIKDMSMDSLEIGLNGKTVTSMVSENLKQVNLYGFKNGVEGLSRMAQKAVEFRMSMSEVFKFAEKVWEPDKALELVANLQVIGGAFGDLNDPIKLMYMATNNVEGLQDALIGAAESLVTFNDEQGRFEVTGANLRRMRAMADEMDISYEELTNTAIAGAERTQAAFDLAGTSWSMNEDEIEFLTNLARMENGKMVIDIPKPLREQFGLIGEETQLALSDMTDWQKDTILEQKKMFEQMDPKDIPRRQVMALENVQRDVSALRGYMRVVVGQNAATIIEDALGINGEVVSGLSDALTSISKTGVSKVDGLTKEALSQVKDFELFKNIAEGWIGDLNEFNEDWKNKSKNNQTGEIKTEATTINLKDVEDISRKHAQEAARTNSVETKKIDITVSPSQASMDDLARVLTRDQKALENFIHSFLNPNSN